MSQPSDPPTPVNPSNPRDEADDLFLKELIRACDDRGKRAALRRWWSPATRAYAYPVLGGLRAIDNMPKTLTAALYAVHPNHSESARSIGQTCLRLGGDPEAYEAHFRRLLASSSLDDLGEQLHRAVKRASRNGSPLPVNYARLLRDLRLWDRGRWDAVKIRWAQDFWQAPSEELEKNEEHGAGAENDA